MPQRSLLPRMLNDSIHRELIARLHFRGAEVLDHVDDDGLQGVRSLRYTIDEHRCCRRNPLPHCRASRCSSGCNLPGVSSGPLQALATIACRPTDISTEVVKASLLR